MQEHRRFIDCVQSGRSDCGDAIVPTTTLAAETGNNTSTSAAFAGTTNGNLSGNRNISKMDVRSLLYPGSTTKVYAHFMPWFGGTNHLNVGYKSDDPAQVARQVSDMRSRGLSGAIIDWYGPNKNPANTTSLYIKQEAEKYTDFDFAVTEDKGALNACAATAGCDLTGRMILDLTYAYNTFEQSPAYMRVSGRPLVFFFGVEAYTIDWTRVRNGVPGNPIFIFRNSGAFSHAQTGGGFGWTGLSSDPNNMGLGYIDNFYSTGLKYPTQQIFGSSYKGFDDSMASWGKNRLLNQQCGQTWMTTMAESGKYFSSSKQLPWLQLVTWNDYEEGTALEMGIDNCVGLSATVSGTNLNWTITGQTNTIDHYTVFISLDGTNLMPLADIAAGTTSLNLGSFSLASGTYKIFVKAVGKPFLTNKISAAASYTVGNLPPTVVLKATPTSGTATLAVSANTSGSSDPDGTIASTKLDFGDGTIMSAASGSHSYTKAGSYLLRATVTDNLGASASTSSTITVQAATNQTPVAKLTVTPTSGTAALTVTASTAGSSDPDGTIASTKIDFGDGTVLSTASGTHVYSTAGSFIVKATVTDNSGASASTSVTVTVATPNQPPVAKLTVTPTTGTAALTVTASTAGSSDPNGTIASTKIDFGDGTVLSAPSGTHVYSTAGSFIVKATVTDNSGASASASVTVTVAAPNQPPVAKLTVTPTTGTAALTVTASTAGSSDPNGTIASTKIDFGDGTVLSAVSGTHTYPTVGSYIVKATVTDNSGASASASLTVTVKAPNQLPVAKLTVTPTTGTAALTVTASTVGSSDSDGTIASTKIDFGDGTVLSAVSGTHIYLTAGSYIVKATVTDNSGASASTSATVTVQASTTPATVKISAPLNNSTVSRWATVSADASGPVSISNMQILVDGVLKTQVTGSSVSVLVSLTAGAHAIKVQSIDATGSLASSTVNVTAN